jgi:hypothetical protein
MRQIFKDCRLTVEERQQSQKRADYDRVKSVIDNTQEIGVLKIACIMIENYEKNYQIKSRLRLIWERKINYLNFESK